MKDTDLQLLAVVGDEFIAKKTRTCGIVVRIGERFFSDGADFRRYRRDKAVFTERSALYRRDAGSPTAVQACAQTGLRLGKVREGVSLSARSTDTQGLGMDAERSEAVGEPLFIDRFLALVGFGPGTTRHGA